MANGITYPVPFGEIPIEHFGLPKKAFYQYHTVPVAEVYPYFEEIKANANKSQKSITNLLPSPPDTDEWSKSYKELMLQVQLYEFEHIVI